MSNGSRAAPISIPDDMIDLLRWVQILYDNPDRLVRLEEQRAELKRRAELKKKRDPRPRIEPSTALLHRVRDSLKSVVKSGFDPGPEGLLALAEVGIDSPLINFAHSARRDTDGVYMLGVLTHRGPVTDAEKHMAVNAQLLRAFARINLSRDLADVVLKQFAVSGDVLLGAGLAGFRDQAGNVLWGFRDFIRAGMHWQFRVCARRFARLERRVF